MLSVLLAPAALTAGLVDELEPLYPDSQVGKVGRKTYSVDVPKGSIAGVHVLLNGADSDTSIQLESSQPGRWYRLIDVPVEHNTGISDRTELIDGKVNPFVVRRAPFRIYDALEPIANDLKGASPTVGLRYEFDVPADSQTGERKVRLTVRQGSRRIGLQFTVNVHKAVVPRISKDSLGFTNWWSVGNVAKYHHAEAWSESFWEVLSRYADMMARARQNTILVPWASFTKREGDRFTIDRHQLRRFVKLFEDRGIYWLEGGHLAGRENNDWMAKRFVLNLTGEPANTPEGRKHLQAILRELDETIRAEGWQKRWLQHIADEPINVNAEDYALIARQVREQMPLIPIFEATMSRSLVGAVQAWCPQVHEFEEQGSWFRERMKDGDRVWVYTCLSPTGPWMNRLLDMERLRPALIPWAIVRSDAAGFLHWGLNYWHSDPFSQSVVPHGGSTDPKMSLPAGDTHIVYPGKDRPWSSTRLEAHRIGFEDAELLRVLKRRNPTRFEEVTVIVKGFKDYTKSVAEYRKARKALLESVP